jgi:hypothetical protein
MPTASPENELLTWLYNRLSTDSELTTQSGINPETGAARAVAIYNTVVPNALKPYVRLDFTDTLPLDDEPHNADYVPSALTVFVQVQIFSTHDPELLNIASRVRALVGHAEVTTANYHGSTWIESSVMFNDDTTKTPIVRRNSLRLRVRLFKTS